jgi:hypothetical protein
MALEPWYKVVTPRKEVREGRSFNPDEFAIALEQVVAGTAPEDYCDPKQFFLRTCFTRALTGHTGMVLRRLSGRTDNTAPVLTLITQFGGGKTHTLTTLYHLATNGRKAEKFYGIDELLKASGLSQVPEAKVAVFVGNAWDPQEGRETPWIDIARQIAGDDGVSALGKTARTTPPGTNAIARVFEAADGPVLILFDEVLNFINRHRKMADSFHAFIQNLTVATTGTTRGAAIVSLPRSQVEMTDWDLQWQDRITKVVRRVAKDLIANDEAEISEVIRRRLFEDIGNERIRKKIAKTYADWCFERRAQLPPEWTAVDTASTETKAREYLRSRFEACYPFHPSALSVFQRKWQALPQYQQTRGTLAMLAQWIAWAYREGFQKARREPLITIGSAPLEVQEFRSIILGQLGESRLLSAIEADISGEQSHARALDADTRGPLKDIHRRVATAILFESSGGQIDKVAHLPELRFALGEPEVDTTSIDNAALALESKAFFIRKVGSDGFRIHHKPTLKKVVSDRRASLDEETEIRPAMRSIVQREFDRGATIPVVSFPSDSTEIQDSPRLKIIVMDPETEMNGCDTTLKEIAEWSRQRGRSPRLYPASLVWCIKKQGRDLRDKVESWLAWKRVAKEISDGTLGSDFDRADLAEVRTKVTDAEEAAKDEVWGGYRYVVIYDPSPRPSPKGRGSDEVREPSPTGRGSKGEGLKVIDLGAGHASGSESLCGRIISALKAEALLNESVGAGYIDRNWPPALKESGAWALTSLRQSFLNGSLTRLIDPDAVLKNKIVQFVGNGDFGLASGQNADGTYQRIWFEDAISVDEVAFETDVFLLRKEKAGELKKGIIVPGPPVGPEPEPPKPPEPPEGTEPRPEPGSRTIRVAGVVPPELWNRFGTKILPKLRSGDKLSVGVDFRVTLKSNTAENIKSELNQIIEDLGLWDEIEIEEI